MDMRASNPLEQAATFDEDVSVVRRVLCRLATCPTCNGLDPEDYVHDPPHTLCPDCGGTGLSEWVYVLLAGQHGLVVPLEWFMEKGLNESLPNEGCISEEESAEA